MTEEALGMQIINKAIFLGSTDKLLLLSLLEIGVCNPTTAA